jgi:hypothetical protein
MRFGDEHNNHTHKISLTFQFVIWRENHIVRPVGVVTTGPVIRQITEQHPCNTVVGYQRSHHKGTVRIVLNH